MPCGFPFETCREGVEDGLVVRVEGVVQRALCVAVALADELQYSHRGDQAGGDQFLERTAFCETQCLDIEALGLERSEQLLDGPALTIEGDYPAGIASIVYPMAG